VYSESSKTIWYTVVHAYVHVYHAPDLAVGDVGGAGEAVIGEDDVRTVGSSGDLDLGAPTTATRRRMLTYLSAAGD
jgi:hypothetical protein